MSILEEILTEKRKEVALLGELKAQALSTYKPRGFLRALLSGSNPKIIAEIKKASPSKGVINPDLDPVLAAKEYFLAGANCISVLTDEKFFQGHKDFIPQIRNALQENCPKILRKEFIIDEKQIWESRALGADAILLIVAALSKEQLKKLVEVATLAELDILLEVHSIEELDAARFVFEINNSIMLGVNNRDLKSFSMDLRITERVFKNLNGLKPSALVAESGIFTREDLEQLSSYGADAFLVGESLVSAPGENLEKLRNNQSKYAVSKTGYYGSYGGKYAPEVLMPALEELEAAFEAAKVDPSFVKDLNNAYENFIGRPTPLLFCENLTNKLGGAKIFIKNEGTAHTGAHKINHCVGQALLAKRMGKKRLVAETGAGQHGLASSTVAAKFGLECVVYMGAKDMARQRPNVFWMEKLGAKVVSVEFGGQRLKDAVNAALKDWITNVQSTHYLLGSALGPHPFPEINRYFQNIIGQEIKSQLLKQAGRLPDYVIACVGGGSNSIGAFNAFLDENKVKLIGVEAGGVSKELGQNAIRLETGKVGVVEGYKSYWLLDEDGQVADTKSISAGLDYAGIGPIHAYLKDIGRASYVSANDKEALNAVEVLARTEGVLPALESAHAVAHAIKLAPTLNKNEIIVVNLSGRAEKDIFILAKELKDQAFYDFLKDFHGKA